MMRNAITSSAIFLSVFCISTSSIADINDGLVAYWPFDGSASDVSGHGNHGTVHGASLTYDRFGTAESAYSFDGFDDYISIGKDVKPSFPVSVSVWFRVNTIERKCLFRNDVYDATEYSYGLATHFYEDGRIGGRYHDGGYSAPTNKIIRISDEPVLTEGEWHHFLVVFAGHKNVKLYFDGEKIDGHYVGEGSGMNYSGNSGAIGHFRLGSPPDQYFNGDIDDVRVYDRVLTDIEINELAGLSGIKPNRGGNAGIVTINIYGYSVDSDVEVKLTREGSEEIAANPVFVSSSGRSLTARFDLTGAEPGDWTIVLINPGQEPIEVQDIFTVELGGEPNLLLDILGRDEVRVGRPQTYKIFYENRGSVDAVGVPLWISGIPRGASLDLDFDVLPPVPLGADPVDYSEVPTWFVTDEEIIVPLLLPIIPAGSTGELSLKITPPQQNLWVR